MSGVIKVLLPGLNKGPSTGKGFFFHRLAKWIKENESEIEIFEKPGPRVDIALHNTKVKKKHNAKCNIVRIDGVYHNSKQNYNEMNSVVFWGFNKNPGHELYPDGVIYQSNFSKEMADIYIPKFAGKKFEGKTIIIPNGADPNFYDNLSPINNEYKYNFITTSRWRPHKRLRDIIESFLMAGLDNSGLYVVGDIKEAGLTTKERKRYRREPSVDFLGRLNQRKLAQYLISSDVFIHLCWIDSCPNGVVEAICAGLPVITNNVGGTHEIIDESGGYALKLDKFHNCKPCDLYHPPAIDRKIVADAMIKAIKDKINPDYSQFDIKTVAPQYVNFFKDVYEDKMKESK